jgi:hypothetical protein
MQDRQWLNGALWCLVAAKPSDIRSAELAELRHAHGCFLAFARLPRQAAAYGINAP